jgi:hypothetical protein
VLVCDVTVLKPIHDRVQRHDVRMLTLFRPPSIKRMNQAYMTACHYAGGRHRGLATSGRKCALSSKIVGARCNEHRNATRLLLLAFARSFTLRCRFRGKFQ